MAQKLTSHKSKQKTLLKASLFNFKNLFVLGTGIVAGASFSYILIPIGIVAYGVLCYLDLSSEEFAKKVLTSHKSSSKAPLAHKDTDSPSEQAHPRKLKVKELQDLREKIFTTKEKIRQLYDEVDDFIRKLLGDFSQTESLTEKSDELLFKAQNIRDYLASENVGQIQHDITTLQEKIRLVSDDFSRQQYQQALNTRYKHLETLREIQQVYERLVSQLTNISISLESMYSRIMKLKTTEYSLESAESDQVTCQLNDILQEVEQLDSALNDTFSLPG